MVTEKRANHLSDAITAVFGVGLILLGITSFIPRYGNAYMFTIAAAYIIILLTALVYVVMYFVLFRRYRSISVMRALGCGVAVPIILFAFGGIQVLSDVFGGCRSVRTEVYSIPVAVAYERMPQIGFSDEMWYKSLYIPKDVYEELSQTNPVDESRMVMDMTFNEQVHPHFSHIEIEYYPHLGVIREIHIDEK